MNQQLFSRFEMLFLDFVIQALSGSRLTRSFLRQTYQLLHRSQAASLALLILLSGMAGLLSGCLLYVFTNWR